MTSLIGLKLLTITHEGMGVRPRFVHVICLNTVEKEKSRIVFEQTSYILITSSVN